MTVQAPTRTAVFEGLVIFSNYSLKVRAFTRKGPGPWSSLINTTTSAGGMFLVTSCLNILSVRSPIYLGPVIRRQIQDSYFSCLETLFFGPSKGIWNPGLWIPDSTNDWNPVPLIKNTESIAWASRRVQTSNCRQREFPQICLESFQIQV